MQTADFYTLLVISTFSILVQEALHFIFIYGKADYRVKVKHLAKLKAQRESSSLSSLSSSALTLSLSLLSLSLGRARRQSACTHSCASRRQVICHSHTYVIHTPIYARTTVHKVTVTPLTKENATSRRAKIDMLERNIETVSFASSAATGLCRRVSFSLHVLLRIFSAFSKEPRQRHISHSPTPTRPGGYSGLRSFCADNNYIPGCNSPGIAR
jgi:hypothetical protein